MSIFGKSKVIDTMNESSDLQDGELAKGVADLTVLTEGMNDEEIEAYYESEEFLAKLETVNEADVISVLNLAALAESLGADEYNAYLESEEFEALVEAGKFARRTLVKFTKEDDLERRMGRASIELGRQMNDPEYKKYKKFRKLMITSREKMDKKYGNKAAKVARASQKEYMKLPKVKASANDFNKAKPND